MPCSCRASRVAHPRAIDTRISFRGVAIFSAVARPPGLSRIGIFFCPPTYNTHETTTLWDHTDKDIEEPHELTTAMHAQTAALMADRRKSAKDETINRVCKYASTHIEVAATLGHRDTLITVPMFIPGTLQYDLGDMIVNVMADLDGKGYHVVSLGSGGRIYVSWRHPKSRDSV